jgi:hypothetical protein
MNVQLLTPAERGHYLEYIQRDITNAEHFILITAFATADGIDLLEPAMRSCLEAGGQGRLALLTVAVRSLCCSHGNSSISKV